MRGTFPTIIDTAMVSPRARPSPSIVAPTIPLLAYGRTAIRIDSYLVAPSARAPSRSSRGTTATTSRVTAVTMGRIMIARITPAVNRSGPLGLPRNSAPATGTVPIVEVMKGSMCRSRNGLRTNRPHSPYTTLGMAASTSTNDASGARTNPRTSFNRSARPTATGTASATATAEVTSVPKMNGSAPKASRPRTGFHARPKKKPRPNRSNVRQPPTISSASRSARRPTSPRATAPVHPANNRSPRRERR